MRNVLQLFSQSPTEKAIELDFLRRLAALLPGLPAAALQRLAVTGEFEDTLPAIEDQTTPAPARRFEDLKGSTMTIGRTAKGSETSRARAGY